MQRSSLMFFLASTILIFNVRGGTKTTEYEDLLREVTHIVPNPGMATSIRSLVLKRDVATFELNDGTLYLCTPVNGRICAATFVGHGRFLLRPPTSIEREQVYRFYGKDSLNEHFTFLFLMFGDTTDEELLRKLSFGTGTVGLQLEKDVAYCLDYVSDDDKKYLAPEFVETYLGAQRNDLFYAHFSEEKIQPLFFEINPFAEEGVRFMRRYPLDIVHAHEVISQFKTEEQNSSVNASQDDDMISISHYTLESRIADDLDFSCQATIDFKFLKDALTWFDLALFSDLYVDSLRWSSGKPAQFVQGKESPLIWVQCESPSSRGASASLKCYYHGPLLEKSELDWIGIKSPRLWYPTHGVRKKAVFDITFTSPAKYTLVSVGKLESMIKGEETTTSHWLLDVPSRNASFNIGFFKETKVEEQQSPNIVVYMSETGHKALARVIASSLGDAEERVRNDVVESVKFYESVYGKAPMTELRVTEVPYGHGEAFPGLIHLSWITFQRAENEGQGQIFRGHEVAHQWWGIGVDFKTYHDQWLSEAFAQYSGLWYMQTAFGDNERFFDRLEDWKDGILSNRKFLLGSGQEAGPIWLGYRTQGSKTGGDYDLIVYRKGAWVIHMLRNMLINLKTMNEDLFKSIMRDFYGTYAGSEASTEDFQRIVEKHVGKSMAWFFRQWVYQTAVPTYDFSYQKTKTPDGHIQVNCKVWQKDVPDSFRMDVPILVKLKGERYARMRVGISGPMTEFTLPLLPEEPEEIVFNDLSSVLCEVNNVDWK